MVHSGDSFARQPLANITNHYLLPTRRQFLQIFTLTRNIRLESCTSEATQCELIAFANWILSISDGTIPIVEDTDDLITIPDDFLLTIVDNPLHCIVDAIYPNLPNHLQDKAYFNDRAILCPTLSAVDEVNSLMLSLLPGDKVEYLSADSISK
ncbi:uncharacterized protein LOC114756518 [Neltuma alba]|uniref:uncharacterized protein LOC114756518 n=1 Tax=Neltuma alba TaxID=207710 RepID=UPI0010A39515|nr:uncharacterized protein LOC114756518 [Prosopis alba]